MKKGFVLPMITPKIIKRSHQLRSQAKAVKDMLKRTNR